MKVGDLVTLSASAKARDTLWAWSHTNPTGIITAVKKGSIGWAPKGPKTIYRVQWSDNGPKSREGNHGWTYSNKETRGWFYRRDLKFISKVKK